MIMRTGDVGCMFYTQEQKNVIEMIFPHPEEFNLILGSIGNLVEKEILRMNYTEKLRARKSHDIFS